THIPAKNLGDPEQRRELCSSRVFDSPRHHQRFHNSHAAGTLGIHGASIRTQSRETLRSTRTDGWTSDPGLSRRDYRIRRVLAVAGSLSKQAAAAVETIAE